MKYEGVPEGVCGECGKRGFVHLHNLYRQGLTVMVQRYWRCHCGHGWTDDVEAP